MNWTTPADIQTQVLKLWNHGWLLTSLLEPTTLFPRRLTLKAPDSGDLSNRFDEVRDWIAKLASGAGHFRIEWRQVNHRILGANDIPAAIWIDTREDALALINKQKAAKQFVFLVKMTGVRQPELLRWVAKKPLRALELANEWPHLLSIVAWLASHPRPAIYLRQIDLPEISTKFIEGHRGVLTELLDYVLPSEAIDDSSSGISGFCRRYGFLDKPLRVRFRLLDPEIRLLSAAPDQDITISKASFASLELPVSKVLITENEINFLAFPQVSRAMVIFGAGYGFNHLEDIAWLTGRKIHYWGDIDTHGFAILNQLRRIYPDCSSFLMDQTTLLEHQPLWGTEPKPETAALVRLRAEESKLYEQLRRNYWGDRIRLEQERIRFDYLLSALERLDTFQGV